MSPLIITPVALDLSVSNIGTVLIEDKSDQCTKSFNWAELSEDLVSRYKCSTTKTLMGVIMNQDNVNCKDANHLVEIENVYKQIDGPLLHSSKHLLKKSGNYNSVPGWNEYCKMAHETACDALFYVAFQRKTMIWSKF